MLTKTFFLGARGRAASVAAATAGLIATGVVAAAPATAANVWFVGGTGAADTNSCTTSAAPCATVAGAMAKAGFVSGDTIDVAAGTYNQRLAFTTKGANLVGLDAGAIFDGGAVGNASTAAVNGAITVGLTNITLRNGSNSGSPYGGNLRIQAGTVNATNVTITGGVSQLGGGVVQYAGTTFTMTGGAISNNTATSEGGALFSNGGTTTLTNVAMDSNKATTAGGAVMAFSATTNLTVNNGTISNSTSVNGGAIYNFGNVTINGTTVSSNLAKGGTAANGGNGGAVVNGGSLTLNGGATFTGNQATPSSATSLATGWGGAIFNGPVAANETPTLTVNNATISGGSVTGVNASAGGAIANAGNVFGLSGTVVPGTVNATNLTVSQNLALIGGGIYAGGPTTLTNSSVVNNQATSGAAGYGGGIYEAANPASGPQPSLTLDGTAVNSNKAAYVGGGIATLGGPTTTIRNGSSVNGNTSSGSAGGVYNTGTLTVTASQISGNTSAFQGGGLYNGSAQTADHPTATLTGASVDNNTAANVGGGIQTSVGATLTTSGGEVNGNTAVGGGGIMVGDNGSAAIDGTTFSGNTSSSVGGGAILNSGATTVNHATLSNNHSMRTTGASGGGAAIYSGSANNNVTITLRVTNSTIANNDGFAGSALTTYAPGTGSTDNASIDNTTITGNTNTSNQGAITSIAPVTITNSTITNNTSANAGAIYAYTSGPIGIAGSIISGNSGTACAAQSATAISDGGYNLVDSTVRCNFGSLDKIGNPQLGALADNGGPTQTLLPGPASAALDKIPASTSTTLTDVVSGQPVTLCASGATDQRGTARPQGAKCDIGSVEVVQVAPTVNGPTTATYTVGVTGTAVTFTTTGTPQATLTESGALPAGVTFKDNGDGTATLSGKPTAGPGGQYPITVTATNEAGSGSANFTLVLNTSPTLTGPSSATYTVGTAGTPQVFSQSGGYPTATLSTTSTLPSGVTFTPGSNGTGTIAGTPATGTGGVYPITITGDNGTPPAATWPFTLTVNEAPGVSGPGTATFVVGTAGNSGTFTATGYPTPTISASGLPSGLSMTSTGSGQAKITGTAAVGSGGTYNVTVTAANGVGTNATTTIQVTVNEAASIQGSTVVRLVAGTAGSTAYTTNGFPIPSLSESGTLPSGVTFVDNHNGTATLGGTAATSAVGTYNLTITAHNGIGSDATTQVTLQIVPPLSITTTSLGSGSYGTEYGATVLATGGVTPYSFAVTSGSLPGGLSMASNGTISGKPTGVGTFNFTVTASDSNGPVDTATANLSITIAKGATTLTVTPYTKGIGHLKAVLTGGNPSAGIAGATITFKAGKTSTVVCTAVTDATGTATCTLSAANGTLVT
ncbi:MAG: beta strand repeat-containing protein, partial [Marmoricola sp.]